MFRHTQSAAKVTSESSGKLSEALEGLTPHAAQLANDVRSQLADLSAQLHDLTRRKAKRKSHAWRNATVALAATAAFLTAIPRLRNILVERLGQLRRTMKGAGPARAGSRHLRSIKHEIEVGVPVSTAYNQWTQFEEFPSFMEGVDEVKQLDDTLLHWAVTVGGKRAEWEAKITELAPDRRIAWESVDGRRNGGIVTFEPVGTSRTRIRVDMSYLVESGAERAGSVVGLDSRRVQDDLERFRDLVESRRSAGSAPRSEVENGGTQKPAGKRLASAAPSGS